MRIIGLFVFLGLLSCGFGNSGPDKMCKKAASFSSGVSSADRAKCVATYESVRKKDPQQFACMQKCMDKATSVSEYTSCSFDCPASGSSGSEGASDENEAERARIRRQIDGLASTDITYRLRSKFGSSPGYSLISETDVSGGWIGTVMIGRADSVEEVYIYKIGLLRVPSNKDCESTANSLRSGQSNAIEVDCGDKQLLSITCVGRRESGRTGSPEMRCPVSLIGMDVSAAIFQ